MLAFKQVVNQIGKNRVFALLLFLLCVLTSASFFFVRFSLDGNIHRISEILTKGGDGERYRTAISSNTTLANVFLVSTIALTSFVFFLFFYRFTRANKKQLGCLKALGFADSSLRRIFVGFTLLMGLLGGVVGLMAAYPLSQVLIDANVKAYGVTGLTKSVSVSSLVLYFALSLGAFALVAFASYFLIKGKEPGVLIAGNSNTSKNTVITRLATRIAARMPVKNKLPLRVMLRKPIILLLIFAAVMVFSIFMFLSFSINISSGLVMDAQTNGHHYNFTTTYSEFLPADSVQSGMPLLQTAGIINPQEGAAEDEMLIRNITGLTMINDLLILKDLQGQTIAVPQEGTAVIGKELYEVYGVGIGDRLNIEIKGKSLTVTVVAIARNAQANAVYVNGHELSAFLGLKKGQYNVLLSAEKPWIAGETQTNEERVKLLEREAVSNKTSAVINQVIGASVGSVLLLLAIFLAFQDNTHDMLILRLMGYGSREIRKMFMDIYRRFVWVSFAIALVPSLLLVKNIMGSLSVATGDYMPFATNAFVILFVFLIVNVLFQLVLWLLGYTLFRSVKNQQVQEYISAE